MTTIYDLLTELETWLIFDPIHKTYAERSKITDENNVDFKVLVSAWSNGVYDEDVEYAGGKICRLLTKEFNITALSFGCAKR